MTKSTMKGAVIASAVASLFATTPAQAKAQKGRIKAGDAVVKCSGVNECKGKGSCSGADNTCKAKNECKGKGWIEVGTKACADQGGKVVKT